MNDEPRISPRTVPSLQALEAAALMAIAETIKDSPLKPSEQAVMMAARAMALRALRESQKG